MGSSRLVRSFLVLTFVFQTFQITANADDVRVTPTVKAIREAAPSVLQIHTTIFAKDPIEFFLTVPQRGSGSGIVVDARGYILTNNHVVKDASLLTVEIPGEEKPVRATVLATLPDTDLALIKVETKKPLRAIKVGASDDLELGETVIAIGFPMGIGKTVSQGILSGRLKDFEVGPTLTIPSMLQTDAAINPGNSGGALINLNGEMVGLVMAMHARAQNIGFSLPADDVRKHLAEMIRKSSPEHANPGFVATAHRREQGRALYVDSLDFTVDGQGLMYGDRIVRVNGSVVVDEADVEFSLLGTKPGDNITVEVDRGGMSESIQLLVRN